MVTKKTTKKKATEDKVVKKKVTTLPPNPTREYGASVRHVRVGIEKAALLISKFEFRCISSGNGVYELIADSRANRAFEEAK
tara:strand:+ start:241 stop:486 length:246 start_codon:yes stop_codon:yes gene_type:complete